MMSSTPKIAVVIAVHHKPWLSMATLITLMAQNFPREEMDIHVIFNRGNGEKAVDEGQENGNQVLSEYQSLNAGTKSPDIIAQSHEIERRSYTEYDELARQAGINSKLSNFDERLEQLCRLECENVFYHDYENDHALDSGVWWKFIRAKIWKPYDYIFMLQEGTLLTSENTLKSALSMAKLHDIQILAGAHMKTFVPKSTFLNYNTRKENVLAIDKFHDRMIANAFQIMARDPAFASLHENWDDGNGPLRQYHVRDFDQSFFARVMAILNKDRPLPSGRIAWRLTWFLRKVLPPSRLRMESLSAQIALLRSKLLRRKRVTVRNPNAENIFISTGWCKASEVADIKEHGGLFFHFQMPDSMGWLGAGCNHMFSNKILGTFDQTLHRYALYDLLKLPFSGTSLEVIWGALPKWFGQKKWYFDGFHRVTKDPWTLKREDSDPHRVAMHLNRYFCGSLTVHAAGDQIKITGMSSEMKVRLQPLGTDYIGR